jgi:hypothetical protein
MTMGYTAKILADSISSAGHRLTSWEVTFPRIVLAEMNTHCMLSRNSASSRAIPVAKRIADVSIDPFIPEAFGRNQKGMQPGEALDGEEAKKAEYEWRVAKVAAVGSASRLSDLGVHKQYANRLLEPFSWHTAVVTATDLDNFFHLRVNPLAQGELRKAAELMQDGYTSNNPRLCEGEWGWHTPYVEHDELISLRMSGVDVAAVSVARCARVSYLTQNGTRDVSEDLTLYKRLVESGHMSPLEHVARPMTEMELQLTRSYDVSFNNGPMLRTGGEGIAMGLNGITAVRGPLYYCGKLNGWISRRAHVPGEWDIVGARS